MVRVTHTGVNGPMITAGNTRPAREPERFTKPNGGRLPRGCLQAWIVAVAVGPAGSFAAEPTSSLEYGRDIAPILRTYCAGCHGHDEPESGLNLDSYEGLVAGGEHGRVLVPGSSDESRLMQALYGKGELTMPPEDEPRPDENQIKILADWIDAGALGPAEKVEPQPATGRYSVSSKAQQPVTAIEYSPDGRWLAIARNRVVELKDTATGAVVRVLPTHPGKVHMLRFRRDRSTLFAASGIAGRSGTTLEWCLAAAHAPARYEAHSDILYAAVPSPDGRRLATAGYDRRIVLWDTNTGQIERTMDGHHGAIFDLAFSSTGKVLASASADSTVKLWNVDTGERLDTLSQPTQEQYCVVLTPDDRTIIAAGADHRIRAWRLESTDAPRVNPILQSRFAHDGTIVALRISADGHLLASTADNHEVKLWDPRDLALQHHYPLQPDIPAAIAIAPGKPELAVGRMDGSWELYPIPEVHALEPPTAVTSFPSSEMESESLHALEEHEPNNQPAEAEKIELPARVAGMVRAESSESPDPDCFRFACASGERWVLEVDARRSGSKLDSRLEVVTADGAPVPQVVLQAVRDTYFTFRGKNSDQSDDFRLFNSDELRLNEFLFANGEVVKLYYYPRGPDSGFMVHPGFDKRHTFFGTTALSHAMGEPCYVVLPFAPGTALAPTGLPSFEIPFENDDDPLRQFGSDSRLAFVAPTDGDYVVRVSDVRGFSGGDFTYHLTVRRPHPDFGVVLQESNVEVSPGTARKFELRADRRDGFDGEIQIAVENVPEGFLVSSPLSIEAGQLRAWGAIYASTDATLPPEDASLKLTATAQVNGHTVTKEIGTIGPLRLGAPPKMRAILTAHGEDLPSAEVPATEIEIHPGETITATLHVERLDYQPLVTFGKEDAGRNLPHGVYVDNIGLNGVLVPEGETERTIFITADRSVLPMTRTFFLEAREGETGFVATPPVILRVVP